MASKSFENGATSPAAKRRRIALACTACRLRKSRCDGRRPSCASCLSLNFDCQYEPSESAANIIVRKEYISDLDQRVTSVEQVVQRLNFILEGHLTACSSDAQCRPYHPFPATTASTAPDHENEDSARAIGLEEPQDEDATTNGMAMTFVKEHTSAFFGGSSNINFTRLILGAVNHMRHAARREQGISEKQFDLNESNMAKASLSYANPVVASPNYAPRSMTTLPSTEEMDSLLDIYFDTAGVVFPFIHEETLRKTYADGKANGWTRVRRTWLGILNMIFAMASSFDRDSLPSAQQRQQRSNVFFKRARDLCDELSKQVISLEIVHYLLLFVIHCQGSQRSVQAWNVLGLVVRSAMALGLHSTPAREATEDHQTEYRRRTWVVIYCMDKVLSVAFGRPVSIPDEFMVDRSRPSESALTFQADLHSEMDVPGKFLDHSFRLYKIMNKSLQKQYAGNVDTFESESDDMASLHASAEFKKELRNWSSSLPPYLQLREPKENTVLENAPVNRLCVILTLRYHNINTLIHRPLLGSTIRHLFGGTSTDSKGPSYLIQLAMVEAHECIHSAQSTIELVYSIITRDETSRNNLGMWYFTLHYVFTASLVILGRILWAQHGADVDEAALAHCKALLGQVETIFQKLDEDNSLVFSCSRYLRNMLAACTSQDATMTVQNDGHEEPSLSFVPRMDQQPPDSASAPNAFESMTYLGMGDLEMFELYSSETYDPEIFAGMERFSANGAR